jgi:hypothetical protein
MGPRVTGIGVDEAGLAWMSLRQHQHESLVANEDLPATIREEDMPFVIAIRRVAEGLSR